METTTLNSGLPSAERRCDEPEEACEYRLKHQRTELDPPARTLKIELHGDAWKGNIIPKIRLMGRWLEQAGFKPGRRVQVTCLAPGVIELRSPDALIANETKDDRERLSHRLT